MQIITDPLEMQGLSSAWRQHHQRIVLVPTMGYFHDGHISLMEYGRRAGDYLVVSLFVNPTQFGPHEDLERYPRDLDRDCELAAKAGVDVIFAPTAAQMYPNGYQTYVEVTEVTKGLCGTFRPGHFRGVTTVVLKLFNIVQPHVALFGEKDYQQLVTIQRMVTDLNLPVQVVGCPLVREADGLALSSRNVYLTPEERQTALKLSRALFRARDLAAQGVRSREEIFLSIRPLLADDPLLSLEYLALIDPQTLTEVTTIARQARLAVAAWVGQTRLIDNILLEVP